MEKYCFKYTYFNRNIIIEYKLIENNFVDNKQK